MPCRHILVQPGHAASLGIVVRLFDGSEADTVARARLKPHFTPMGLAGVALWYSFYT